MNIVLWVLQVLLAVAFFAHGWLFLFPPPEMLELMNSTIRPSFRIFIGVAEVLAAVGLTLPGITRVLPWLVPSAAAGLMIVMVGATILHVMRGEWTSALTTAVLFLLATWVAYMRWKVMPIQPRTVAHAATAHTGVK
jgi:putative oxidoreductase